MSTLQDSMQAYKKQLEDGPIREAYQGLMKYLMNLRTYFKNTYPDFYISSLYQGYMDMSFFSIYSSSLKTQKLKVAILFIHEPFRFEVWLVGSNKQVQSRYWKKIKESDWYQYPLVPSTKGVDAIIKHVLVENPDFNDFGSLTKQIENETMRFIQDVEGFLSKLNN